MISYTSSQISTFVEDMMRSEERKHKGSIGNKWISIAAIKVAHDFELLLDVMKPNKTALFLYGMAFGIVASVVVAWI